MAHYLSSCSLLVVLQLLFLLTNGAPLDDVCRGTKEPPLCLSVLGSDPRSRSATLPQLAEIAIDAAEFKATATKVKIHALLLSAKSPSLKNLYGQCENNYLDALSALAAAPNDLAQRRYGNLRADGGRVVDTIGSCERVFPGKSPFADDNRYVSILGDAIAVAAQLLSR